MRPHHCWKRGPEPQYRQQQCHHRSYFMPVSCSPVSCTSAVALPLIFYDASHADYSRGTEYIKRLTYSSVNTQNPSIDIHSSSRTFWGQYFNCSFQYHGQNLNEQLLAGPTFGPSLLDVILRFRQHAVAVSGDIKGIFHQVRLLPGDKSVLRFIWRNLTKEDDPDICEWQVLPFGTTCSPCCTIYALQHHAQEHRDTMACLVDIVETLFYVDNCLHSTPNQVEAKAIIDGLRQSVLQGGF